MKGATLPGPCDAAMTGSSTALDAAPCTPGHGTWPLAALSHGLLQRGAGLFLRHGIRYEQPTRGVCRRFTTAGKHADVAFKADVGVEVGVDAFANNLSRRMAPILRW
eukprot:gene28447-35299_t